MHVHGTWVAYLCATYRCSAWGLPSRAFGGGACLFADKGLSEQCPPAAEQGWKGADGQGLLRALRTPHGGGEARRVLKSHGW